MDYFKRLDFPIAAAATAKGGPLVVFRVSGKDLSSLKQKLVISDEDDRRAKYCNILDVDQGLVLYFKNPKSFTGEEVLEFHVHGSDRICESLMESLKKLNVLEALPGEFSFRALMNEKMSLAEAESLHTALSGASSAAISSKLVNLSEFAQENTEKILSQLAVALTSARGRLESAIDFSEAVEEQAGDVKSCQQKLDDLGQNLDQFLTTYENFSRSLKEPRVLIVGEPNSGKSSLLNLLLGAERSLVSSSPGTTRDYIEAKVKLKNQNFIFVDTAGIRFLEGVDEHEVERRGIDRALKMLKDAHAILWVKAANKKENPELKKILSAQSFVVELQSFGDESKNPEDFDLRCDDKRLRSFLAEKLLKKFHVEQIDQNANIEYFLSERQILLLCQLRDAVKSASFALSENRPLELVAEDLKNADRALKTCQGKELSNDYIAEIFSQFCLGK